VFDRFLQSPTLTYHWLEDFADGTPGKFTDTTPPTLSKALAASLQSFTIVNETLLGISISNLALNGRNI
jgi:hypothetical protein